MQHGQMKGGSLPQYKELIRNNVAKLAKNTFDEIFI